MTECWYRRFHSFLIFVLKFTENTATNRSFPILLTIRLLALSEYSFRLLTKIFSHNFFLARNEKNTFISFLFFCQWIDKIEKKWTGWTIGIDSRSCIINGRSIADYTLETIETTAYGANETHIFSNVHFCNRYTAMATAYCRFNGWHHLWHRTNNNNGAIFEYYQIRTKI